MIETVIAVLVISLAFLLLFRLSYMLESKILLEHAAMRVARARSVGLNDFMCRKAARVAMIPVSGERLWPAGDDAFDWSMELARVPEYMQSENEGYARGILEYEGWHRLGVRPGDGTDTRVSMDFSLFDDSMTFGLEGKAGVEANATLYMMDQGL